MIDLSALDADQRRAATAPRGPVAILAGAGTGKTRTITYRIAHQIDQGQALPQQMLAVTFTRRAAMEMRHRLQLLGIGGVQAQTFHSAAMRQLRYFWPQIAGDLPWKLLDAKFPIMSRAVRHVGLETGTDMIRDVLAEVEWAKASLVTYERYAEMADGRNLPAPAQKIAAAYERYEELKRSPEGMLLDYDDLLIHTAGALEHSEAIALEFRQQYKHFVVDEYQDVTPLQHRVLKAWLGERENLTVVGDANQTIYSFTGATPDYLLNFSRDYPNAVVVKLQRDYRSTKEITDLANEVIGKATGRVAGTRLQLEGMRPSSGVRPVFCEFSDEPAEARAVAEHVQLLTSRGIPASEIAVLYRTNAQAAVFEEAFGDAGLLYQVRGGEQFFQRSVIRSAMTVLEQAARQAVPAGPAEETLAPNGEEDAAGSESAQPNNATNAQRLARTVRKLLIPVGLSPTEPEGAQARERWQALEALANLVEELGRATPDLDLPGLVRELRLRAEARHAPTMEGVTLASIHAAKGLEWDVVFLVGLVEGMVPIRQAIRAGEDQIEEERRLLYVGITRAREHLLCSWSQARQEGGRQQRKRTRFLDGVAGVPARDTTAASQRKRRAKLCRVCQRQLRTASEQVLGRCNDCPGGNEEVFELLRSWRRTVAKEEGHPAYLVFTDATLRAIAEALPESVEQLLSIPGVGQVKAGRYGEDLLSMLAQFR